MYFGMVIFSNIAVDFLEINKIADLQAEIEKYSNLMRKKTRFKLFSLRYI